MIKVHCRAFGSLINNGTIGSNTFKFSGEQVLFSETIVDTEHKGTYLQAEALHLVL